MGNINEKTLLEFVDKCLTWGEIISILTAVSGGVALATTSIANAYNRSQMDLSAQVYAATNPEYKKDCEEAVNRLNIEIQAGMITHKDYDKKLESMSSTDTIIQHILNNKKTEEATREKVQDMVHTDQATKTSSTIGALMLGSGMLTMGLAGMARRGIIKQELDEIEASEASK